MAHPTPESSAGRPFTPRLIAWEVTRSCPLACKHCRAAAKPGPYEGELSTEECLAVLDNIAAFAKPILILTGGEPMLREDIYDIAAHATQRGLRVVMAPCGGLLDEDSVGRILGSGIDHISISLDGATAAEHDDFRGMPGAFEAAMRGVAAAKRQGLGFQINTTVTRHNLQQLSRILELAVSLGASVFNPFLLVPTGRGKDLADQEISPAQYEQTLRWLATQQDRSDIAVRVTCAPHYQRVLRQSGLHRGGGHAAQGCMGGRQFAFISHRGVVQICGFLDTPAGDLRAEGLDFQRVWDTSDLFAAMRNPDAYHGRCGYCEFASVCGGCRARAFAVTGDPMAEEPFCLHEPKRRPSGERDDLDDRLLSIIQADFPIAQRPFDDLAERLSTDAATIIARINRLSQAGSIRRLGAIFDSKSLGYVSTLVAAKVPADRLADVANVVSALAGVTHNYRREHPYNLWFTLTCESIERQKAILDDLTERTAGQRFCPMPALAVYKIRVNFQLGGDSEQGSDADAGAKSAATFEGGAAETELVRILQGTLPLTAEPFAKAADRIGWPVERVIEQVRQWRRDGVIRRFGAVVDHHRLGFSANGMAVFRVADDEIAAAGRRLARRPDVSHCYRRPPIDGFDYNLFAMVHARTADALNAVIAELVAEIDPVAHDVLLSTTQFKKTSMKYFQE